MKFFVILLVLIGFTGVVLTQQQVFAGDSSLSFDSISAFSESDFDTEQRNRSDYVYWKSCGSF